MSRDIKCFEWAELSAVSIDRECLVGRLDRCNSGAVAGGFRSGFRLGSNPFSRCGHERAFTYNYVKHRPEHAALHDLSASQSEAARSECVVHVKAASEANLQATNYLRHDSNTLQNGTQYQTHNSSFITHNSGENIIGRFLSPDPYIQAPYFAQNFDRYSYVWNNPLKYVDPSGYLMKPYYRNNGLSGIGASRMQYNNYLDWAYGRGLYALEGPGIVNMEFMPVSLFGGIGGGWFTLSSSGMMLSDNGGFNGAQSAFHDGSIGVWVVSTWQEGCTIVTREQNGDFAYITLFAFAYCETFVPFYSSSDSYFDHSFSSGSNNGFDGTKPDLGLLSNTGGGISLAMSTNEIGIGVASRFGEVAPGVLKFANGCRWLGAVGGAVATGVSVYNIVSSPSTATTMDYVDAGVGGVGLAFTIFCASNPLGWVVGGATGIYFIGRAIYEEVNNP